MSEFRFKQFTIKQEKTAMKVSTDGVLLGAWANFNKPKTILDIGTGTGLLAIMAAQKHPESEITAIEINNEAYTEAKINAQNCTWNKRIKLIHADFLDFSKNEQKKFDLIISNPPYYENQLPSTEEKKRIARHNDSLPFNHLIASVSKIITNKGVFCVIIPNYESKKFIHLCSQNNLFLTKKLQIFPNENKKVNRVLLEFSKEIKEIISESIFVRKNKKYSAEYLELTKDFYLFAN